ncbi:glycosyltransferase family 1 protein [Fibrobacter sp. UWB10]|uniref:glycosyltransferase family 4 protein n=1 Tax=Fibrobacter sp. UWB10 TaxID=1896201 RepID=UPI0024032F46|nr:glycosyltransferase family 1 protein [Fibrobacter sp. UWB10]SMP40400.1 Glycosyltransferase involved in cell wall bisynthesis [Fibrobacter sp. UWB10]
MHRFALNGRFTARKLTGQERFAKELILELDKLPEAQEFVLVVPEYASCIPELKHIEVVKYGRVKSHLWEQISFYRYIKKNKLLSINLTTTCPFFSPDIVCIHDAAYYEISNLLTTTLYGKLSTLWHKLLAWASAKWAKKILTVSNYSKTRLSEILKVSSGRIDVVYDAWQHFNRVGLDDEIFSCLPANVKKKEYILALSSLLPQKNFIWIKEVAKRNSDLQFVVCGKSVNLSSYKENDLKCENVHFTGYISDAQVKSLMSNCLAFVHPAIYEGFGIPPLEAMSCGAKVVVSRATCLPELYEDAAYYIDPYDYDVDLKKLLSQHVASSEKILKKFDWGKEAKKMVEIVKSV